MSIVLDSGALIAIERNDRPMIAIIKRERRENRAPLTHGGVIGQVWRSGQRSQVNLAHLLPGVDIRAIDHALGLRVGLVLGAAGTADVIDAAVVLLASNDDEIFTSDPSDLRDLAVAAGLHVELVPV
ncbi:MAG: twitching motility protein PilT [Acidimicrobiales bacterium]